MAGCLFVPKTGRKFHTHMFVQQLRDWINEVVQTTFDEQAGRQQRGQAARVGYPCAIKVRSEMVANRCPPHPYRDDGQDGWP